MALETWWRQQWARLAAGARIPVPAGLPHPSQAGFTPISVAVPVGQIHDWGLSLSDGSRIHVHEYSGGRFVAHRDRHDPSRGLSSMGLHLLTETYVGPVVAVFALVLVLNSRRVA